MNGQEHTRTHRSLAGLAPHPDQDLGYTLQDLVLDSIDVGDFLTELATVASDVLSTANNSVTCSITVIRRKRGVVTASSDARGRTLDELQNGHGNGPCLTALRHGSVIFVPDTRRDSRWTDYMEVVRRHGIGSILAVPLEMAGEAEAVMNLYSENTHGFSGPDISTAEALAGGAAKSLRLALRIAHLRDARDDLTAAMQSRSTIDTAVGIVMSQNRCGRDAAFKVLTQASNNRNMKLRDIAAQVIASISGETDVVVHFEE